MGSAKPGATYIYEHADGVTYSREFGADPSTRKAIGWELGKDPSKKESTLFGIPISEFLIYAQMHEAAKTNPALQTALERAKITYYVSKENAT